MCRYNHPGCTEAALQTVTFPESLLNRMEFAILRESFNRCYLCAICLYRQHRAGLDCLSIYYRRASAAQAGLTSYMRASESGDLSKVVNE